jgi:hypothetical protein
MFFARSLSLRDSVEVGQRVDGHRRERQRVDVVGLQRAVVQGGHGIPDLGEVARENSSVSTMIVAPRGRSARLALSAAGFIATSTSGASPGVSTSWSAKCNWKLDTPGGCPGGPDLGGEVGQGGQVVAEDGGVGGEPVTGQLHAVAGVAGEADDHPIQLAHRLVHGFTRCPCSRPEWRRGAAAPRPW